MKTYESPKQQILRLLNWEFEKLATYQYNQAVVWLEECQGFDEDSATCIMYEEDFWNWWAVQWNRVDRMFIRKNTGRGYSTQQLREIYEQDHTARRQRRSPGFHIMSRSYDRMIDRAILKNHKNKVS